MLEEIANPHWSPTIRTDPPVKSSSPASQSLSKLGKRNLPRPILPKATPPPSNTQVPNQELTEPTFKTPLPPSGSRIFNLDHVQHTPTRPASSTPPQDHQEWIRDLTPISSSPIQPELFDPSNVALLSQASQKREYITTQDNKEYLQLYDPEDSLSITLHKIITEAFQEGKSDPFPPKFSHS